MTSPRPICTACGAGLLSADGPCVSCVLRRPGPLTVGVAEVVRDYVLSVKGCLDALLRRLDR